MSTPPPTTIQETLLSTLNIPQTTATLSLPHIPTLPPSHQPPLATALLTALDHPPLTFTPLTPTPTPLLKTLSPLDTLLHGGFPFHPPAIHEISGPAGIGKTQTALQLALLSTASAPVGQNCPSILACTEGSPPISRIHVLDTFLCNRLSLPSGTLSARVIVEQIRTVDNLLLWARHRLPYLLRETGARLVVLDSVAAVYRPEFDCAKARAAHLAVMAGALLSAVATVDGVVVCVNQVSQSVGAFGELDRTVPALGPAWSHCVQTRLFLYRGPGGRRFGKLLGAPHLPPSEGEGVAFVVAEDGIGAE